MPKPLTGETSFLPLEWDEFFAKLSSGVRCEVAIRLCRVVVSDAELTSPTIDRAIAALASSHPQPGMLCEVQSVVDRLEAEYDMLVGDDEGRLACSDPPIAAAFVKARAAWAVKFALEGKLRDMAYEAWCVLNDQNEVRRLVGMEPAPSRHDPRNSIRTRQNMRTAWHAAHVIREWMLLASGVAGLIPGVVLAAWRGWGQHWVALAALVSGAITIGLVAGIDRLFVRSREHSSDDCTAGQSTTGERGVVGDKTSDER